MYSLEEFKGLGREEMVKVLKELHPMTGMSRAPKARLIEVYTNVLTDELKPEAPPEPEAAKTSEEPEEERTPVVHTEEEAPSVATWHHTVHREKRGDRPVSERESHMLGRFIAAMDSARANPMDTAARKVAKNLAYRLKTVGIEVDPRCLRTLHGISRNVLHLRRANKQVQA
jgi:hypothetical protein